MDVNGGLWSKIWYHCPHRYRWITQGCQIDKRSYTKHCWFKTLANYSKLHIFCASICGRKREITGENMKTGIFRVHVYIWNAMFRVSQEDWDLSDPRILNGLMNTDFMNPVSVWSFVYLLQPCQLSKFLPSKNPVFEKQIIVSISMPLYSSSMLHVTQFPATRNPQKYHST